MPSAQDLLTIVETAIQTRINGGTVESYNIDGQNVSKTPLKELFGIRDKLQAEVAAEAGPTRNLARFKRPS